MLADEEGQAHGGGMDLAADADQAITVTTRPQDLGFQLQGTQRTGWAATSESEPADFPGQPFQRQELAGERALSRQWDDGLCG